MGPRLTDNLVPFRILIIGSDAALAADLSLIFIKHRMHTHVVEDYNYVVDRFDIAAYDAVVVSGHTAEIWNIAPRARFAIQSSAPLILIADTADVTDRIIALESGADELFSRPLDERELVARVRSLVRRTRMLKVIQPNQAVKQIALDENTLSLRGPSGARVSVSRSQCDLLKTLIGGHVISLADPGNIGHSLGRSDMQFRSTMTNLRRKLVEAGYCPTSLRAVRGSGYELELKVSPTVPS